jgi:hypothetical protein
MKTITLLFTILISLSGTSGTPAFNQAMQNALTQFGNSKNVADFQNTANSFQRISNTVKEEWLPEYYQAQCYILMSFMDQDPIQKDAFIDLAETAIKNMMNKTPENSEVYALQAFMYTARLVVDPVNRGREYSILSMGSLKKSLAINPQNPRALYLQLSNEIGTADFFGNDVSVYCDRINNLVQNWDDYNVVEPLFPSWGKKQASELTQKCIEKNDINSIK